MLVRYSPLCGAAFDAVDAVKLEIASLKKKSAAQAERAQGSAYNRFDLQS